MYKRTSGIFAIALVLTAAGVIAGDSEYSIENVVNSFDEERVEPTAAGYQYWFADKAFVDGKTLKLSVVRPHAATGGPMTSFYCPSGMRHGIRNIGDTELKYLVIKKYLKK